MDIVLPKQLFLGSLRAGLNIDQLLLYKVTHILVVGTELKQHHPEDFVYKKIEVEDHMNENIFIHFQDAFSFIDEAINSGGCVLVHCAAGISRSSTIVIGYLMTKQKRTFSQALNYTQKMRPIVAPNWGFRKQLEFLEKIQSDFTHPSVPEYIEKLKIRQDSDTFDYDD
eukprot:TRINITY_DN6451_c0_g1_i1.p1 TRINITY_DN6451_c0_g1~~TRINITY_DN6451_c0_g1_i1.p1  ORF type:complete len:169 (-),score=28.60 TRINITY_DN6451_c0_g1_i1:23-529(-)